MASVKPNFLVAGAGKAGTTSLHEYLAQHPEVFMSAFKEPNYFVPGYGYDSWQDYLALFAGARDEKAVGESSTGYFYCEQSPSWIKSLLGHVKIILILRNPARRAASLYWWMVREGYENAPTFARALELESSRMQDPTFRASCPQFYPDYLYYTTGLYSEQLRRYLDTFGEKNVRVYIFEEFIKQPVEICRDMFDFLDVDPNFKPTTEVHNQARVPASASLQYWLRTKAPRYFRFIPTKVRQKCLLNLMNLNTRKGSAPAQDTQLERSLIERYHSDISRLEQLLNRDLSMWYDPENN
jgi:Sulfotransferase domain